MNARLTMRDEAFGEANGLLALARHLGATEATLDHYTTGGRNHQVKLTTNAPHQPTPEGVMGQGSTQRERRLRRQGGLTLSRWDNRYKQLVVTSRPPEGAGWQEAKRDRQLAARRRPIGTGAGQHGETNAASAAVNISRNEPVGLSFTWEARGEPIELIDALELAGRYSKLQTKVNGDAVEPKDFLEGARLSTECGRYRIGVYETTRHPGPREGELAQLMTGTRTNRYQGAGGVVLAGTIVVRTDQLPVLLSRERMWYCRVEAPDGDEIGPASLHESGDGARGQVWNEIRRAAAKAVLEASADSDNPPALSLADRNYAQLLTGRDWPREPGELEHWRPDGPKERNAGERGAVERGKRHLLVNMTEQSQGVAAALASSATQSGIELWRPDEQLNGYPWYDGLTRIVAVRALSTDGAGREWLLAQSGREQGRGVTTGQAIKIELELTTETHETVSVERLETDLFADLGGPDETYGAHYTDRTARLSLDELTARISRATWHDELDERRNDSDDDGRSEAERETEREQWRSACVALAIRIRGSRREDDETRQRELIGKLLDGYRPSPGQRTIIEVEHDGPRHVRFEPAGSKAAN